MRSMAVTSHHAPSRSPHPFVRANRKDVGPPEPNRDSQGPIRHLQRTVGNRAIGNLLGQQDSGRPLDPRMRVAMEARFGASLAGIRIHRGIPATMAASMVAAQALTVGQDIVLGDTAPPVRSEAGHALLEHEVAHAVQQGPQSTLPPLSSVTHASDGVEREAGGTLPLKTDRVPRLARQLADAGVQAAAPGPSDPVENTIHLLTKPDPIAGIGNPSAAMKVLAGLPYPEMLAALGKLADLGHLPPLLQIKDSVTIGDPGLKAAVEVLHVAQGGTSAQSPQMFATAGQAVDALTPTDRDLLFRFLIGRMGQGENADAIMEGVAALMEAQQGIQAVDPMAMAGITAAVTPGPWAPPGNQPIPYYIGNQAHVGISLAYAAVHPGDVAFHNFSPLSTILDTWINTMGKTGTPGKLKAAKLGLKPDITNLSRTHLYEIKPKGSEAVAMSEAKMYQALFASAGVPISLGPTTEPGTSGGIPAPAGIYLFSSPDEGVITYQYRQARVVPVPVPAGEKSTSKVQLPRFRLEPIHVQVAATITVGAMMLYMLYALAAAGMLLGG